MEDGNLSAGIPERNPTSASKFSIIINTFENMFVSQGRCFMIKLKKTYEPNLRNNTIKNCQSGGALFQIRFIIVDDQSLIQLNHSISSVIQLTMHYITLINPHLRFWFLHIQNQHNFKIEACLFLK